MSVTVRIPTPLRKLTGETAEVTADGADIAEVLQSIDAQFPGIMERLCDESGQLRKFVNVYVGEEDIRFLDGLGTKVDGQVISIIPAVAGG